MITKINKIPKNKAIWGTEDQYSENNRIKWMKSKMTQTDWETYNVLGLEDLTSWKWLYCPM